ncbi:Type II secretory pathway component PulC-like protein [Denitrovibrio acetiphilus DSM 12809]|uniref:Type II secretory pathway component PulC-like protein n=1 Tax=Denitrovibrio acetiphilus (strain DSM 12809 / NBRC 114555 / N2460) TaxID=522772 RepID=D4H3X6_DENA2|nr:Type II secretory pathway component PulC-like protein [Denitrovibrio acetiphilus]ADD67287.1 Type II secretory pathway component PulC-like protein [Denitrovibrio acetiphilus DSM 12809]
MKLINYKHILYSAAVAFSLAWAVSGWVSMYMSGSYNVSIDVSSSKDTQKAVLPDTDLIIEKNIFDAEISEVVISDTETQTVEGVYTPAAAGFKAALLGVLTGDEDAIAVITFNDKNYILRQGIAQDGLELVETGYFHVVVRFRGKDYRLILTADENGVPNKAGKISAGATPAASADQTNFKISRKEVVEKLSDVNSVIKSVLIIPYERNGNFEGYRVRRMAGTSILKKLGVQRNDVIMRLNGRSLESPSVFFDTLKNAEDLSAVSLDILRSGKKMTIYVEIEG